MLRSQMLIQLDRPFAGINTTAITPRHPIHERQDKTTNEHAPMLNKPSLSLTIKQQ
jgi:hypothetical protein